MNFTHYDLGGLDKGKTVEVILQGNAANVYLMDHENMVKYNKGLSFQALGGLMPFSPIRMQTTDSAHWHVVIDMPKGYGTVKTSYRMVGRMQPNISTRMSTFKPSEAQLRAIAKPDAKEKLSVSKIGNIPLEEQQPSLSKSFEQVSCKNCGTLNMHGKFCSECGTQADKLCTNCSTFNVATCKFCSECGLKLE